MVKSEQKAAGSSNAMVVKPLVGFGNTVNVSPFTTSATLLADSVRPMATAMRGAVYPWMMSIHGNASSGPIVGFRVN